MEQDIIISTAGLGTPAVRKTGEIAEGRSMADHQLVFPGASWRLWGGSWLFNLLLLTNMPLTLLIDTSAAKGGTC
jgi:hypothetical protein